MQNNTSENRPDSNYRDLGGTGAELSRVTPEMIEAWRRSLEPLAEHLSDDELSDAYLAMKALDPERKQFRQFLLMAHRVVNDPARTEGQMFALEIEIAKLLSQTQSQAEGEKK